MSQLHSTAQAGRQAGVGVCLKGLKRQAHLLAPLRGQRPSQLWIVGHIQHRQVLERSPVAGPCTVQVVARQVAAQAAAAYVSKAGQHEHSSIAISIPSWHLHDCQSGLLPDQGDQMCRDQSCASLGTHEAILSHCCRHASWTMCLCSHLSRSSTRMCPAAAATHIFCK